MKIFLYPLNSCGMRNMVIQRYRDFLAANGHEPVRDLATSEAVILWTCAFRKDVRDNSLGEIRRLRQEYPGELIVAGCLPDMDPSLLGNHFSGRVIPWRRDAEGLEDLLGGGGKKLAEIPRILFKAPLYADEAVYRQTHPGADVPYVGRYIQLYISEGCPWNCTYCSERLAFPPYQSFPEDEIIEACARGVGRSGKSSAVLLGDSVGDYGLDTGTTLIHLMNRLFQRFPGMRIGLQDLNPAHFMRFSDDLVAFITNGRIAHLQIPYQSASDRILRLMARPYRRADIERVFGTLNRFGFREFDAHMIVGFPGEAEEDFQESLQFAVRYHPKYVLVNGFMETPAMPAAGLPGKVSPETKAKRIQHALSALKGEGIICNCDGGELARERFRRVNSPTSTQ